MIDTNALLVFAYVAGFVTPFAVILAWWVLRGVPSAEDEPIYVPAEFVSRSTLETFATEAEAKAHARREQGWHEDGPTDDSWRAGFTIEPARWETDGAPEPSQTPQSRED